MKLRSSRIVDAWTDSRDDGTSISQADNCDPYEGSQYESTDELEKKLFSVEGNLRGLYKIMRELKSEQTDEYVNRGNGESPKCRRA